MTELEERKPLALLLPSVPRMRLLVSLLPFPPPFRGFLPRNRLEEEDREDEGNGCKGCEEGCKVWALSQCSLASQPEAEPGMFLEAIDIPVEAAEEPAAAAAADAAEA